MRYKATFVGEIILEPMFYQGLVRVQKRGAAYGFQKQRPQKALPKPAR